MSVDNYHVKYLKYKNKYNELKNINQYGGTTVNTYGVGFTVVSSSNALTLKNLFLSNGKSIKTLSEFKKELPQFKLFNLNTLKNININDILGPRLVSQPNASNSIKNKTYLVYNFGDPELNAKIISEVNKNYKTVPGDIIIVMIIIMPSLIYTDINSSNNVCFNILIFEAY